MGAENSSEKKTEKKTSATDNGLDPKTRPRSVTPTRRSTDSPAKSKSTEKLSTDRVDSTLLTPYQKNLMQQNWRNLPKENLGPQIVSKMLVKSTEIREIFDRGALRDNQRNAAYLHQKHNTAIVELLDTAVKNLNKPRTIEQLCFEFGATHCPLRNIGLHPSHFDVFGEAASEAVRGLMRQRPNRELLHAWTLLCCFMVEKIRQGYTNTVRRRRSAEVIAQASEGLLAPTLGLNRRPSSCSYVGRSSLMPPSDNF